jgi:hypothetical protein
LGIFSYASATQYVNLTNLEVTEKDPATFILFNLFEGDLVDIGYRVSQGDANKMRIEIISVNSIEPEVIKTINYTGEHFSISEDGNYHIKISTEDDLLIDLVINRFSDFEPEHGEVIKFKFDSKISETETPGEYLKFFFDLEAGDEVIISSSDGKSMAIKVNYIQGSQEASVASGSIYPITSNGTVNFHLYLDKTDKGLKQKIWSKIFGKKDLHFRDINFSVHRQQVFSPSSSTASSGGADDGSGRRAEGSNDLSGMKEILDEQRRSAEEEKARLFQQIESGNASSAEQMKMMMDYLAKTQEEQKLAEEERKKQMSRARFKISARQGIPIEMTLYPKNDFLGGQDRSRKCEAINLPGYNPEDHSGNWFYMLFVGDKVPMDSIIEFELTRKHNLGSPELVWDQEAINWHHIQNPRNEYTNWSYERGTRKQSIEWPNAKSNPEIFGEDVSYVIIPYESKELFEQGRRVASSKIGTNVMFDRGMIPLPAETELYFCATNDNLTTPVNLVFYYFTIEAVNTNVDSF